MTLRRRLSLWLARLAIRIDPGIRIMPPPETSPDRNDAGMQRTDDQGRRLTLARRAVALWVYADTPEEADRQLEEALEETFGAIPWESKPTADPEPTTVRSWAG